MKTLAGQLLKGNMEALKLELGVGSPVFGTDFRRYGARLLYKHLMYVITLALYRWHWVHGQTRRILGDRFPPTQTIGCITAQHQTRDNSALGTLANSSTTSLRINCSRFPTRTFQMTYGGLLSPEADN
jgi:hypothetical protein